ncbi:MAG: RtcB family protein, partial [Cyanobacteria bacterium HKST-UBA01]|nr:RtcB family protein [Cyanobacteria bacterium HKST-UBA01]
MRTDAKVFSSPDLIGDVCRDLSLEQVANVATLPGIVGHAMAMPDMHQGYGFPIGGVAAMDPATGVVSPGGVGFDINCGVRLLSSPLSRSDLGNNLEALVENLF